jgi:hypothetical protein
MSETQNTTDNSEANQQSEGQAEENLTPEQM